MSGQFSIYKPKAAVQFRCKSAEPGATERDGCVFMDIAPGIGQDDSGNNRYDWENKIVFAFALVDLGQTILGLRTKQSVKLYHDPSKSAGAASTGLKVLVFEPAESGDGSWFLRVSQGPKDGGKSYSINLSAYELLILGTLMQDALSKVIAWGK